MVKRSKANTRGAKRKTAPRIRMKVVKARSDNSAAQAYKRLLVDPCYAQIPTTPYPTSAGAVVARNRATVVSSSQYQIVFFHPLFGTFSYADTTTPTTGLTAGRITPYSTFLNYNGPGRGVAGCLSAQYTSIEQNRAGMIYCGIVSGAVVYQYLAAANGGNDQTLTPGTLGSQFTHVERMPVDKCEINWVPGEGDSDVAQIAAFNSGQNAAIETAFAKTNFCAILVYGTGGNNVVQFGATAVYEYMPSGTTGLNGGQLPWDVSVVTRPKFDYRSVVEDLAKRDTSWFLNTFKKVGNLIGGAASGYMSAGLPGALSYLTDHFMGTNAKNNGSRLRFKAVP